MARTLTTTPVEMRRRLKLARHTSKLQRDVITRLAAAVTYERNLNTDYVQKINMLEEKLKTQRATLSAELGEKRLELVTKLLSMQGQAIQSLGMALTAVEPGRSPW